MEYGHKQQKVVAVPHYYLSITESHTIVLYLWVKFTSIDRDPVWDKGINGILNIEG